MENLWAQIDLDTFLIILGGIGLFFKEQIQEFFTHKREMDKSNLDTQKQLLDASINKELQSNRDLTTKIVDSYIELNKLTISSISEIHNTLNTTVASLKDGQKSLGIGLKGVQVQTELSQRRVGEIKRTVDEIRLLTNPSNTTPTQPPTDGV